MSSIINVIISALLQTLIFTAIPFVVYLIKYRRARGFFNYIGLKTPVRRAILYSLIFVGSTLPFITAIFIFFPGVKEMLAAPNTVTGQLRLLGLSAPALVQLIIIAFLKTAFAEEILFRGFFGKRLINRLGFGRGNVLQALIFGSVHLLIFIGQTFSLPLALLLVSGTAAGGWFFGYVNERTGGGSIVPGWLMHGLTNAITYYIIAFG